MALHQAAISAFMVNLMALHQAAISAFMVNLMTLHQAAWPTHTERVRVTRTCRPDSELLHYRTGVNLWAGSPKALRSRHKSAFAASVSMFRRFDALTF